MPRNVEIKAHADPDRVRAVGRALPDVRVLDLHQVDTFFPAPGGRLKHRRDEAGQSLIYYRRAASPLARECDYTKLDLSPGDAALASFLREALGAIQTVEKQRTAFVAGPVRLHLDRVAGLGDFAEIEVDVDGAGGPEAARAEAASLAARMGIGEADLLAWSYAEMLAMKEQAAIWRARLSATPRPGRLFLLDGASCSGKTTLTARLVAQPGGPAYVPRYCTRDPRPGERDGEEYLFVSHERFRAMAAEGAFLEYRDFEFGMSYGLAWERALSPVLAGHSAVGVMNLGSVRHVKAILPEAVAILIDVPEATLHRRLVARGINKPHEIEERLGNARRVPAYLPYYDHVIRNDDGRFEEALAALGGIVG